MTTPPSSPIDSILETSKGFNEAAERVADVIRRLDEQLAETGIGTSVYLGNTSSHETEEGGKTYYHRLGYDRIDGGWGICVNRWRKSATDLSATVEDRIYPLHSASRALRMHFIEHVPELLKLLQEKAIEQSDLMKKQSTTLDALEKLVGTPSIGRRPDSSIGPRQ